MICGIEQINDFQRFCLLVFNSTTRKTACMIPIYMLDKNSQNYRLDRKWGAEGSEGFSSPTDCLRETFHFLHASLEHSLGAVGLDNS